MDLALMVFIFISTALAGALWYLYLGVNQNMEEIHDVEHLLEMTSKRVNRIENLEDVVDGLKRRIEEINIRSERHCNELRLAEEDIIKLFLKKCPPHKKCTAKKKQSSATIKPSTPPVKDTKGKETK